MQEHIRPNWDEYMMKIRKEVGSRATCDRGRSGAVISVNKRIIATGYVGSVPGEPHCDQVGHKFITVINEDGSMSKHCNRTIHAEENAILQCAEYGISPVGGCMHTLMTPCWRCAMKIARVGITRVVAEKRYHADAESIKLFERRKIELVILNDEVEEYNEQ